MCIYELVHLSVALPPPGSEDGAKKSRARVTGSMAGDVPEKYYVVRNNEVMRVRYLVVYAEKTKPKQ